MTLLLLCVAIATIAASLFLIGKWIDRRAADAFRQARHKEGKTFEQIITEIEARLENRKKSRSPFLQ